MIKSIQQWFHRKWLPRQHPQSLLNSYHATFSNIYGQDVLQHLIDSIYCTVYEGSNPNEALVHNARRSVVHEILTNIDMAQNPVKYLTPANQENGNAVAR